jgi:diguanylate cyclase (GGDEF)-like protein/PAS domain S-box-containing protein
VLKSLEARIRPEEVLGHLKNSRILDPIVRGLLWIDGAAGTYRVDAIGRILLCTSGKAGSLSELGPLFAMNSIATEGPQATQAIAFASPEHRYLRMRKVTAVGNEQLFIVEDMSDIAVREHGMLEREEAYRGLFEKAPVGIFRSIPRGAHIHANPEMVRLMGCKTEQEWLDCTKNGISNMYVDTGRREKMYDAIMSDGYVFDFVSEFRRVDGQVYVMSITAWVVYDSERKPQFVDGTVMDVTARERSLAIIKYAAETDELTGLSNRAKLYSELEQKTSQPGECAPFSVLLIDLDRFKDINDVFGHATGDEVLLEVAQRLRTIVGDKGSVARLGGDEFAAVIDQVSMVADAEDMAQKLVQVLRQPISVRNVDHALSASIGIAKYPEHAMNRAELLRKADIALYNVKSHGRNGVSLFNTALEISRQRTHYLAQELREADKRGELELYYQPIVDAGSSETMGFEALMRWHHPARGMVSPAEFIPIAEDSGYMTSFGAWAINEACSHIVTLPGHVYVSVNVSAVQFNAVDFPSVVERALADTGLSPSRLELEVTEGVVLRNEERTITILEALRKIGVRVSLDDFGTGYSSFSYLQKFKFDRVKIDRSFVNDLADNKTNAALVRAVLSIGRDLGMPVVAEGIENAEQRDRLVKEGCPFFQGYLFGKPAPFSDIANTMALSQLRLPVDPVPMVEDTKISA